MNTQGQSLMALKEINGVKFFEFPSFTKHPDVRHGIFTRHGGCSRGAFQSLNVGNGLGDPKDAVEKNRNRISRCIGENDIIYVNQNHGDGILVFMKTDPAAGSTEEAGGKIGDAMVTDIPGKFLAVQVADCQSVLVFDPYRKVVANIHAGWRGSVKNIIGRTVGVMKAIFDSDPVDLLAGIGPSLGPCCAEFRNYRKEIPEIFWKYKNRLNHFDFWSISMDQLKSEGLLPERIAVSGLCTKCRTDLFFSYRGEGTTGRFAAVIGMVST